MNYCIRSLLHISTDQRAIKTARALLWARGIENVTDYAYRITRVLETKLSDPVANGMQAIAQIAQNPYAVGVNIHDTGRDEKTVNALIDQGGALSSANPIGITNLREIAQYLQPWVRMIGEDAQRPISATKFFMSLFAYLQALKKGEVIGYLGRQIHLNPSDVVYYVGVMEPFLPTQQMAINPERSLYRTYADTFEYQQHDFRTDDYMQQFGDREREQLAAAVESEQRATKEGINKRAQKKRNHADVESDEDSDPSKKQKPDAKGRIDIQNNTTAPQDHPIMTDPKDPLPLSSDELRDLSLQTMRALRLKKFDSTAKTPHSHTP
jgi:hypothetical protein